MTLFSDRNMNHKLIPYILQIQVEQWILTFSSNVDKYQHISLRDINVENFSKNTLTNDKHCPKNLLSFIYKCLLTQFNTILSHHEVNRNIPK